MQTTNTLKSTLLTLAVALIASGTHVDNADARGGFGGGFHGGGFRAGGFGGFHGARTSIGGFHAGAFAGRGFHGTYARGAGGYHANVNRNVDVNRNWNANRDWDYHGDYGYYHGGNYYAGYGYHGYYGGYGYPVGGAVAAGATAAAIGSIAYSLPAGCGSLYVGGLGYYKCGGVYYQPRYQGSQITYVVVNNPR